MKNTCNRIKYELNHPENVVKYFTNNTLFYENLTQRKVKAIARKLPFMRIETYKNAKDIVEAETKKTYKICVPRETTNQRGETAKFTKDFWFELDRAYDELATNQLIYSDSLQKAAQATLHKNTRVMVALYGSGGTGKTYSLLGDPGDELHRPVPGVAFLAAKDILEEANRVVDATVFVSCYEIYHRKIYDLLDEKRVISVEESKDNAILGGITKTAFSSLEELGKIIEKGRSCWKSSLKHPNLNGRKSFVVIEIAFSSNLSSGGLIFVDMAADEQPLREELWDKEARMAISDIKQTFVAFKECARAIETTKKLPPFRSSQLTAALKPYFLGNCSILVIGHINPTLQHEQNIFRTLNYCNKIRKPPGEILNLQEAKTSTVEMKIVEDVAVATKIDYKEILKNPNKLLINNSEDQQSIDIKDSPFADRLRSLLNSHHKSRPKTASFNTGTPSKFFLTGSDSFLFPTSSQKPAVQNTINAQTTTEGMPKTPEKPFKKSKKGKEDKKTAIERRATKIKQNVDGLLRVSEPSESENCPSPLLRMDSSIIRKFDTPATHDTPQRPSYFFTQNRTHSLLPEKKRIEIEDDLEVQEQIAIENKIYERKAKLLVSKDRDKHFRSSQEKYEQRDKYSRLVTPQLSPERAARDALRMKRQYYHMATRSLNPELTTKSRHNRYRSNKELVHDLCSRISGLCDDEKVRNNGMRQSLSTEIASITTDFTKIKDVFRTHEEEIINQLKNDYYEEKSLENHSHVHAQV